MKLSVKRRLAVGTALGICISAAPAFAQQAATPDTSATTPAAGNAATNQPAPATSQATAQTGGLQDIIVTARHVGESEQHVPIAITTVTPQKLEDLTVRNIMDIQKVTPGLFITGQNSGGRAKFMLRGQAEADSRLTTDGSVGLYVDGVNIPRTYGVLADLVDIARIEVLKGPQGTLFGKNTTGGAINITTVHPDYQFGGYVDALYGNYDNRQITAAVTVPIVDDVLSVRAVGQRIVRDGYGKNGNGVGMNNDNTWFGRVLVRFDPTSNVNVLLSWDGVKMRNNGNNAILTADNMLAVANKPTGALGDIAAELGLDPNSAADRMIAYGKFRDYYDAGRKNFYGNAGTDPQFDNVTHWGVSGQIAATFGDVTLKSITSYRHEFRSVSYDPDLLPFSVNQSTTNEGERNFSQELQVLSIDGQGLDWQFGAYYNREWGYEFQTNSVNAYVNNTRSNIAAADVTNSSIAGYAQAVYNFSPRVRVTAGLRFTHDYRAIVSHNRVDPVYANYPPPPASVGTCNLLTPALGGPVYPDCNYPASVTYNRVTYLVSADWRPVSNVMFYASVSSGYRAGGFTISASAKPQPSLDALNAAFTPFKPESVTNYEAGVKSDFANHRVRINVSGFYQDYRDIQQQIRDTVNGTSISLIRNAAKARLWGAEAEISVLPTSRVELDYGISYLNARYIQYYARTSSGDLLNLSNAPFAAPPLTMDIGASYRVPLSNGDLRFAANYRFTDDVVLQPQASIVSGVKQPGYGLLDGRVTWTIDPLQLDVSLWAKNITNKKYFIAATNIEGLGYDEMFTGDPRTYGIQIRKTF